MNKLENMDLAWAIKRCPNKLLKLMKDFPNEVFIAGGFIRCIISNEKVNDIDVFTPSAEKAKAYALMLVDGKSENIYETENAITVKGFLYPIQFIHRWSFKNLEECVNSFDFSICRAGFYWKVEDGKSEGEWSSFCHEKFYSDLAGKRLVYLAPIKNEDAGGSMLRVLKYYQKGFRIPLDSLGLVMARMFVEIETEKIDSKNINEVAYILTGFLREVYPSIDPEHIAHISTQKLGEIK